MKSFWNKYSYRIITTLTIVILITFSYQVMAYLISLKKQPEKKPPKVPVRSVIARQVEYGTIKSPVTGDGRVVSMQEIVVSTEVRGKIMEVGAHRKLRSSFSSTPTPSLVDITT